MNKALCITVFIVALVFLIWFIMPIISFRIINPGNILGIIICLYLMFWGGFNEKYVQIKQSLCSVEAVKILWRIFNVCATAFVAYAVIISALMVFTAYFTPPAKKSTAVVLGAQVKPWGPSTLLQQRIDASVEYLKENPEAVAVVTGGKGSDEPESEAKCMYDNIVKQGINGSRIYKEDKATNTKENILFSNRIITDNNLNEDIAIITDSYHQFRARIIMGKLKKKEKLDGSVGSINSTNGEVGIITYPTYFVREWIAIPVEIFKK